MDRPYKKIRSGDGLPHVTFPWSNSREADAAGEFGDIVFFGRVFSLMGSIARLLFFKVVFWWLFIKILSHRRPSGNRLSRRASTRYCCRTMEVVGIILLTTET